MTLLCREIVVGTRGGEGEVEENTSVLDKIPNLSYGEGGGTH